MTTSKANHLRGTQTHIANENAAFSIPLIEFGIVDPKSREENFVLVFGKCPLEDFVSLRGREWWVRELDE